MPQNRGVTRLDTWLTKLLWALAKKQGGEVRLSGIDLEDVPDKCALSTDYDSLTHEIVLRASSGVSEMIVIHTQEQWARTNNPEANSTSSPASPAPRSRSSMMSDEDLAAVEQRLLMRARSRKQQSEADALNKVYQDG